MNVSACLALGGEGAASRRCLSSAPLAVRSEGAGALPLLSLGAPRRPWRGRGPRRRLFSSAPLAVGGEGTARGSTCSSPWCPSPSVAKVQGAEFVLSSATLSVRTEGAGARRSCPVCVPCRRRRGHGVSNCSFPQRPSLSVARAQGVRILVGAPRRRWRGCGTRWRLSLSVHRRPRRARVARQSSFSSATLAVRSEGAARRSYSSSAPFAV